jgi:hypothetical protein
MAAVNVTVTDLRFRLGETGTERTRKMAMQLRFSNGTDDWTVTIPEISTDSLRELLRQIDLTRAEDSPARETVTAKLLNVRLSP